MQRRHRRAPSLLTTENAKDVCDTIQRHKHQLGIAHLIDQSYRDDGSLIVSISVLPGDTVGFDADGAFVFHAHTYGTDHGR